MSLREPLLQYEYHFNGVNLVKDSHILFQKNAIKHLIVSITSIDEVTYGWLAGN